jgi:hypothetical protein
MLFYRLQINLLLLIFYGKWNCLEPGLTITSPQDGTVDLLPLQLASGERSLLADDGRIKVDGAVK